MSQVLCAAVLFLGATWSARAQVVTTVAGGGPNNLPATQANVQPAAVVADGSGNYYVAAAGQNRVFRISSSGTLTVFAGNGVLGFGGDGGDPAAASLNAPMGLALDGSNLYIADTGNNRIRKVTLGGSPIISTIAGTGASGFGGDGGSPLSASLAGPAGLAEDSSGNLYVADQGNNRIRKISAGASMISTIAGNGPSGFSGDGGSPIAAQLSAPSGVAVDASGSVYVADQGNNRIRKVTSGASPIISTIAGNGTAGFSGDGGAAASAQLSIPASVALDSAGNVYIADQANNRIREVAAGSAPTINTIAGNGGAGFGGDGSSATSASLYAPSGVWVDSGGNVYIADTKNNRVREVTAATPRVIQTIAGNGTAGFSGDGLNPQVASLNYPFGVALDSSGNVYIADTSNNRIRKVVMGGSPTISTVAGTGVSGFSGDGSAPTAAQLSGPLGIAFDGAGNLYIADAVNNRIRKITFGSIPVITTVAGNGVSGYAGDGGDPLSAELSYPTGVALDSNGNLYIADSQNNRIRKVTFGASNVISTIAGSGAAGFSGDGGNPTLAGLNAPTNVALDSNGNLYIADYGNQRVRKVTAGAIPTISTVAGTGAVDLSGANGSAIATSISNPFGVAVDGAGNVYISEVGNDRVRELVASSQSLVTVGGNGTLGFGGDGGAATSASLGQPAGLSLDGSGNLYIASPAESRIRQIALGAASAPAPSLPRPSFNGFVTGFNASSSNSLRNNFSGWVGMALTVGANALNVTSIGRICVAGNTGTHAVKFVSAATGTDVAGAQVSVSMSGCAAGQFTYAVLPTPVTLQAGASYYLVSQEGAGADQWYDYGSITTNAVATVTSSIWLNGSTWSTTAGANTAYVPPDFTYTLASLIPVTVLTSPAGASFSVDGVSYSSSQSFSWTAGSSHTIATTSSQNNATGTRLVWSNWSDGGALSHTVSPTAAASYTANFGTQYLLTTSALPSGSGSVTLSPSSPDGYYSSGTSVQVTAAAASSYTFANWSSDITGSVNPQSISMSAPHTVAANFQPIGGAPVSGVVSQNGQSFINGYNYSHPNLRNDYGGWVGMAFTVGSSPLTVNSLGRVCVAGNTGIHGVKFVNAVTGSDVSGSQVSVNMAGCTAGQFVYVTPTSSVTLPAGAAYYLVSQEVAGGDQWYDRGSIATSSAATVGNSVWLNGSSWALAGGANTSYVPPNFTYTVVTATTPATPSGTSFVNGYNYSHPNLRNDYAGWVGMALTVGARALAVNSLGRVCVAGNTGVHAVKFVSAATGTDVPGSQVSVNMAGCAAGQFVYVAPASPLTLSAGAAYYLVSQEVIGGDQWYDRGTIATSTDAAVTNSVWLSGSVWTTAAGPNTAYVPPNFTYTVVTATTPATPSGTSFINGYNYSHPNLRNDYAGWVGMTLTIGASPLTVNSLGRVCVAGNAGTHAVKFVSAATGTDVPGSQVSVNMAGCTAGQFVYVTQPSPVTLSAGAAYYLVSQEVAGGDQWYDHGAIATSTAAAVTNSVWLNGSTWTTEVGPNTSYVPPNFTYTAVSTPTTSSITFVNGYNYSSPKLRNDYGGWVGMALTVGSSPLTVSSLGRVCVAGNAGIHVVKFVSAATGTDVSGSQVSVNMAGCTAGQFVYGSLTSPLTLSAGAGYYLVSQEVAGGDQWYDQGSIATSSGATVNNSVWLNGSTWTPQLGPSTSYVPPNFTYSH